jgi:hypothetical protein
MTDDGLDLYTNKDIKEGEQVENSFSVFFIVFKVVCCLWKTSDS